MPIFGDPRLVEPPVAVRAAVALLVAQAGVTVLEVVRTGADPTLVVLSVALTLVFLHWVRDGREWARNAACAGGFASLVLTVGMVGGVVDLGVVAVGAVLLVVAVRLMYRADVRAYFEETDSESA
ncbi:hypothetical protein ACFPM7_15240 [Actinokineospora guangxiensis]|uniref:Uncharacterized protein n=1 Tax=Actinokineospora guangxiensis TaxID=1490288 RepID=A0ABW0EQ20_9PSEU